MNELKTKIDAIKIFGDDKGDHRILNAALHIQAKYPNRQVIMVSKDINLRIKAKSLNIIAEDYETGKLNDSDIEADTAPTGRSVIEDVEIAFIDSLYANDEVANNGVIDKEIKGNQFFTLKNGDKVKWVYLKDNPLGIDGLAFTGYNDPPEIEDFLATYIDHNKIFERELGHKLQVFYDAIGWGEVISEQRTAEKFFSF